MTLRDDFNAAMSAVMLRYGILGTIPKYADSYMPDPDSYREMGLKGHADPWGRYPSLDEARCTVCGSAYRIDNIDADDGYFGRDEVSPYVSGFMTCASGCGTGVRVVFTDTYENMVDLALSLADSVD